MAKDTRTSADYWRGYRGARIYALMTAVAGYDMVKDDFDETSRESKAYLTGFYAGINALRLELSKLIEHERELEREG